MSTMTETERGLVQSATPLALSNQMANTKNHFDAPARTRNLTQTIHIPTDEYIIVQSQMSPVAWSRAARWIAAAS